MDGYFAWPTFDGEKGQLPFSGTDAYNRWAEQIDERVAHTGCPVE